jgi:sporulation protein YlmC with PRC-barrel domain
MQEGRDMQVEELRTDASVVTMDGHKVGTLTRFVLDGATKKLTHIVVDTGILRSGEPLWKGGWGLSHDRVVPLGVLRDATSDQVRLTMTAEEFRDLSVDYIEERFEPLPDLEPGELDQSDLQKLAAAMPGGIGQYVVREVKALAADAVEVREDMPVWRMNPHQKIGEVERVIFDEASKRVTSLVIRRGFLLTRDVVLPIGELVEVLPHVIRVDLDDAALAGLVEFRAED